MPLVTSQATISVYADGSVRIISVGATDPTLTPSEGKALAEYLADALKALPEAQADIQRTVGAAEAAATRAISAANTEIHPPKPRFEVKGFDEAVGAGTAGQFKVTAVDKDGKPDPDYRGTVHFASTDNAGSVPGDYTFSAEDKGVHEFTGTFAGVGAHSFTVTDATDSGRIGTHEPVYVGTDAKAAKAAKADALKGATERNPMRIPSESSSTALAEAGAREREELAHSAAILAAGPARTDGILPRAITPVVPAEGRPGLEPPATDGATKVEAKATSKASAKRR